MVLCRWIRKWGLITALTLLKMLTPSHGNNVISWDQIRISVSRLCSWRRIRRQVLFSSLQADSPGLGAHNLSKHTLVSIINRRLTQPLLPLVRLQFCGEEKKVKTLIRRWVMSRTQQMIIWSLSLSRMTAGFCVVRVYGGGQREERLHVRWGAGVPCGSLEWCCRTVALQHSLVINKVQVLATYWPPINVIHECQ